MGVLALVTMRSSAHLQLGSTILSRAPSEQCATYVSPPNRQPHLWRSSCRRSASPIPRPKNRVSSCVPGEANHSLGQSDLAQLLVLLLAQIPLCLGIFPPKL